MAAELGGRSESAIRGLEGDRYKTYPLAWLEMPLAAESYLYRLYNERVISISATGLHSSADLHRNVLNSSYDRICIFGHNVILIEVGTE